MSADVPTTGNVTGRVRATNLPLDDIGVIEQFADSVAGLGRVDVTLSGTRAHPILTGEAQSTGLQRNGVTLDRVTLNSQLHDRDADLSLAVVSKGATTLAVSVKLPIDFKLFSVKTRNDAMTGEIHVPATDLSIVQLASRSFSQVSGTLRGDIIIGGTPSAPVFRDTVSVRPALLAARAAADPERIREAAAARGHLADIQCTYRGRRARRGDSLSISRCSATSPVTQRGTERGAIASTVG
jgi:autotransporter translocation and assembly factor TamB